MPIYSKVNCLATQPETDCMYWHKDVSLEWCGNLWSIDSPHETSLNIFKKCIYFVTIKLTNFYMYYPLLKSILKLLNTRTRFRNMQNTDDTMISYIFPFWAFLKRKLLCSTVWFVKKMNLYPGTQLVYLVEGKMIASSFVSFLN